MKWQKTGISVEKREQNHLIHLLPFFHQNYIFGIQTLVTYVFFLSYPLIVFITHMF